MEIPVPGARHERSAGSGPSWPADVLAEVRRQRVGDVPIEVEDAEGGLFLAYLDEIEGDRIQFEINDGIAEIASEDVAAFTLLAAPPPDTSDELRH